MRLFFINNENFMGNFRESNRGNGKKGEKDGKKQYKLAVQTTIIRKFRY